MAGAKFYCYVDETGQDTEGDIFVVSVVVPENRDELLKYLDRLEVVSGKHNRLGVPSRKVRGIRKDENDSLIRLADAICGFVRDVLEGEKGKAKEVYQKASKSKILIEV